MMCIRTRLTLVEKAIVLFLFLFIGAASVTHAQLSLQMLIVGGGGGGGRNAGSNSSGGGGGSGGQVTYATTSAAAGSALTITVGAGGNGYQNSPLVNQTGGGTSSVTLGASSWTGVGGNAGGNATSGASEGSGGASVDAGLGAGGRGGIFNNGNNAAGWPAAGGNGSAAYSTWGAATGTGQLSGGTYYFAGGGAGGNWGGQSGAGDAAAGLGGGGTSNTAGTANTGGGGGGANSNGGSGFGINGGNGGSGLVIIRYAGTPQATGGTITQSGGYTYHTFTSSGTLTLSAILPVVWESFTAVNSAGMVVLDWSVSTDANDLSYEVERSADGTTFGDIGSVPAHTASLVGQYSFTDSRPLSSTAWYRIKQIDAGGKVSFSNTVVVGTGSTVSIQIFPNPVQEELTITLPAIGAEGYSCSIYTISGALVLTKNLSPGVNSMAMQSAVPGIYFVAVWKNGVCIKVERILK